MQCLRLVECRRDACTVKILAILQNMWFHNAEGWRERFESLDSVKRRRLIAKCLFATSNRTGRRIKAAFGDLIDQIEWEESSKEIGDHSAFAPKCDTLHITNLIVELQPDVVICFGSIAAVGVAAVQQQFNHFHLILVPHPMARVAGVKADLEHAAITIRSMLETVSG